jgi:hypothetical protein
MSSPHNLRRRQGGEQKYIEIDSETEAEETDPVVEGDTSAGDSGVIRKSIPLMLVPLHHVPLVAPVVCLYL